MVCQGFGERLAYGEWKIRPGNVKVKMFKTIPTKGLTYDDRDKLVRRLRDLCENETRLQKLEKDTTPATDNDITFNRPDKQSLRPQ